MLHRAASAKRRLLFDRILGPWNPAAVVSARGGVYATYESIMEAQADTYWTANGSNTLISSASSSTTPNYYDRVKWFYMWWRRTGQSKWRDRARLYAVDWRDNYIAFNNYVNLRVSHDYYDMQPEGLTLHFLETGEEASRTAIGKIADTMTAQFYMDLLGVNNDANADTRFRSKWLDCILSARLINAPSVGVSPATHIPSGNNWDTLLTNGLTSILGAQTANGDWLYGSPQSSKPWMSGMLNDSLIDHYRLYARDSRIPISVQSNVNYAWANQWMSASGAFYYETLDQFAAPDLNMLIYPAFCWVYYMTGTTSYKTNAGTIFTEGVNRRFWGGEKQYNQFYTTSPRGLYWDMTRT